MAGYTRQDTSNSIANGNVIDADIIDAEFDALLAAFNASSGHTHDGTAAGGAPITVTGSSQDYVHSAAAILPKTTNTYDLGSSTYKFKDLYVDGVAYLDAIEGNLTGNVSGNVTGDLTGDVTGNLTGDVTGDLTGNVTGNVSGNATTATRLQTSRTVEITGGVSASTTFDGSSNLTLVAVVADDSHNHTLATVTDAGSIASQDADAVAITGGSISGITDLAIADGGTGASTAGEALINFGFTATVDELNYMDGVTSSVQTQLDGKVSKTSTEVTDWDDATSVGSYWSESNVSGVLNTPTTEGTLWIGFVAVQSANDLIQMAWEQNSDDMWMRRKNNTVWGDWKRILVGYNAIDEDDMASDSAVALPTQQSTKAYVDNSVGAVDSTVNASAAVADVGTYAFARAGTNYSLLTINPGDTRAGTDLWYTDRDTALGPNIGVGTWRCMGYTVNTDRGTLWLRIS